MPLNKEEAIVGTDNRGWYKINLKTKQTQHYNVTLHGEPYSPSENRSFFKDTKGYWSTYSKGFVYVDDNSRELETYICLLYTSPSPRDQRGSRMPSSA